MTKRDHYYDNVRRELRARNRDLYIAHIFAPPAKREAVLCLFYIYHEVSSITQKPDAPLLYMLRLRQWHDLVDAMQHGNTNGVPAIALAFHYKIAAASLYNFIAAREQDIEAGGVHNCEAALQRAIYALVGVDAAAPLSWQDRRKIVPLLVWRGIRGKAGFARIFTALRIAYFNRL